MGEVFRWPRHVRWRCTDPHLDGSDVYCGFCQNALFACAVCTGAEGSLTTDCPGEAISPATERLVLARQLDYRGGRWCVPGDEEGRPKALDLPPVTG